MKNKIFTFVLFIVLSFTNCVFVFASSDGLIAKGFSHNNGFNSFETDLDFVQQYQSNFNFYDYNYFCYYVPNGSYSYTKYFIFPKDTVLVRVSNNDNTYSWFVYGYDGSKLVSKTYLGYVYYQAEYCSVYDENDYYYNTNNVSGVACGGSSAGYYIPNGIPIASCEDNALAYFQHMDYSYLENADQFIEVPAPEDMAMYEASSENAIYLYWENTEGLDGVDEITDNSKQTLIEYGYYYENIDGEMKFITGDVIEEILPYSKRTQYFIDTSPLYGYENGYIIGRVMNRWSLGGIGTYLNSPYVEFYYIPYLDEYRIYYLDEDGNYIKKCVYPLNDYGVKNDSFTGGAIPESDLLVSDSGDVDYGFFTYLFNGFGLLGDNGLISLIGRLFSFLPEDLFYILLSGVAAAVVITLFVLFSKA